jgi:His-Xaa-Ser system radical SAM maturase HxsC
MGATVSLPLSGAASHVIGFGPEESRLILRLRSLHNRANERDPADIALVRSREELWQAVAARCDKALLVGDEDIEQGIDGLRLIVVPPAYGYLSDGDIIGVHAPSRRFRTLYRRQSAHNSFLVTERCNHYCLMCSQPPRNVDDGWIIDEIRACLKLVDKATPSLGFTGGEPMLEWPRFINVLAQCRDDLPRTAIHVLTNGRAFADSNIATAWASVKHPDLMAGIPLYAAVDHIHDYVVQARGAFDETVLGILKLKDRGQRVEIRIVLHAITVPHLVETCRWIARSLPFVDHVALMGLENTGFAIANDHLLWIDPVDYREVLAEAVEELSSAGMRVSVYNLQRCILARSVWPFAMQSISDWKNDYVEVCERCIERSRCAGFFTSGRPRYSRAISPILRAD